MANVTDVAQIKDRIALIQQMIAEIERVYNRGPYNLNEADFPCAENLTGPATYVEFDDDTEEVTRIIQMRYYARIYGTDLDGLAEESCEPIIPAVWAAFSARPGLEHPDTRAHLDGVQKARLLSDSGVTVFKRPSVPGGLWGVEFRLQVVYYKQRTYIG